MINRAGKSQGGLSLIELMIAISLGLFITAGMIALYVNAKQSYRLNANMSRLQENARFAVSFISRDIRMADFHACVSSDHLTDAVAGENNTGTYSTDIIALRWQTSATNDCLSAQITQEIIYSIQTGAGGGPALFRNVNGVDQELVEGIENLQILFGENTYTGASTSANNKYTPDYYVDASAVTDMTQVVSIRFVLVARTLESNLTAAGGRITRNFTTTVALRNRMP